MKKPELPPNGDIKKEEREELLSLYENRELIDKVFEVEKDYPYWDKFKHKTKEFNVDSSLLWKFIKLQRGRNISKINICDVDGFKFKYNISGNTLQRLHQFDLNLGGILEGGSIVPEKEKERFLISSLMEEAIASSQLEGAVTTREVAKAMLRAKRKPKNHSEKMILNNYLTIKEIITIQKEKLTPEIIKRIHSLMTKDTLEEKINEGEFRVNDKVKVVDINGEVFYDPPTHTELPKLIDAFCEFANSKNDKNFMHPIVRGIILHFLIGYIHPFVDGNGRTARAIFYWYLISQGYWLVEFLSISRIIIKSPSQYARAYLYTEYDENDLTYFIDFNLKSMELALKSLKEYIDRKITEKKNLFKIIKNENINERQAEIVKSLINEPDTILSINEIQGKFGTSYQTARTDLLELESIGYLENKLVGKKLIFFKSETFDEKIRKIHFA
jgi:Fic family protein